MAITQADVNLANVIAAALPSLIALIQSIHSANNPGTPAPTDAQVLAALLSAAGLSIAVDENWRAAHPA